MAEHRVREEAHKAGGATGAQRERGHGETRGLLENLQQVRVDDEDRGEAVPEGSLARVADPDYSRKPVRGVKVGVEDGDGEAAPVKDAGEPELGVDVALVREREQ
jgi:hypothetical protein